VGLNVTLSTDIDNCVGYLICTQLSIS